MPAAITINALRCWAAGQRQAFLPAPYGVAIDPEAAGQFRPGQAGSFLEPHDPLREVIG